MRHRAIALSLVTGLAIGLSACGQATVPEKVDASTTTPPIDGSTTPIDGGATDGSSAECSPATCTAGPCQSARCEGDQCVVEELCGVDEMCCAGECVPQGCDDGNECTDDQCGENGCEHVDNEVACDDGMFCNGMDTCSGGTCSVHSGEPCVNDTVCSEGDDVCVGCVSNEDCSQPLVGEWGNCEGFADTCAETGMRSRQVMTFTCVDNMCVSDTTVETELCMRDTEGTQCDTTSYGPWNACGGYADTCDEGGTHSRTRTDYMCSAGACTAVSTTESEACMRDTDGTTCDTTTYGPWSSCGSYTDTCDEGGTRSRTRTDYVCSTGGCNAVSMTESEACTRDTDGTTCDTASYGPWSACAGFSDTCDEDGTRSRTRTDYVCSTGGCTGADTTESEACTRDTDGTTCGTTTYGPWSSCQGFSSACDESGTRSRTRTDYVCSTGGCTAVNTTESEACTRDTDGTTCDTTTYGPWGACGGYSNICDESGTRSRTRTAYQCSAGTCSAVTSTQTGSCSRDTDGTTCDDTSYTPWGSCTYSSFCDETGNRSRTRTDYECSAGTCSGTSTTETKSDSTCARNTDGRECYYYDEPYCGFCNNGSCQGQHLCY